MRRAWLVSRHRIVSLGCQSFRWLVDRATLALSLRRARPLSYALALLTVLSVLLTLATQSASSFTAAQAQDRASLQTPQQLSGTAAGRSHKASAASTTAKSAGAGGQHRLGKGELAALAAARGVGPVRSSDPARATLKASRTATPALASRRIHEQAPSGKDATARVGVPGPTVTGSEIASQRTATTSVFQNPDGTRTMRLYSRPVHYKQANGTWGDIDTSLVRQGTDGRWQEKANTQLPSFAATADDPQLVSIAVDAAHSVAYGLQGAAPVAAKVSGSTVTYPAALPFSDVVYSAQAQGIKESLILHSASASTRWVFPLRLTGLTPSVDAHGDVVFTDAAGKVLLTIPRGFMEDSAVNPRSGDGATSAGMAYSLTTLEGAPALVMTLDGSWLHAPGRVFPVTVDPTSDFQQNTDTSAYVEDTNGTVDAGGNASYAGNPDDDLLKVGSYEPGQEANSYLWFSSIGSSTLINDYIENVGVALDETWAAQCSQHEVDVEGISSSWNPDGLSSFPGVSIGAQIGKGTFAAGTTCGNGPQWEPIELGGDTSAAGTQLVQSWAHGGANFGLALTADDSDTTAWKQFASVDSNYPPYLYVTYSPYGASYAPGSSYTAPTYSVNGSESVKLTNTGANSWPSGSTVLKADVYDASGHQIAISNEPSVAVPATAANGTATVTGVLPALPVGDGATTACWDVYVGGVSLNQSYGVTPTCVGFSVQDTAPSITSAQPPSNTTVGELSPQFYATGNDPDNYPGKGLEYEFQVYTNPSTGSPALVVDSGWLSSGSWQVPVGNLLWNASYLWQVRVSDFDAPGLWSSPALFSTTVQQPVMTGQLGTSSNAASGRTFDPLSGDYTSRATDAKVNVVGPPLEVTRSYNSLDPRTTGVFGAGWSSEWDMQVQPDADSSGGVVVTQADGQQERFGRNDFALTQTTSVGKVTGGASDDMVAVDRTNGDLYIYSGPGYSAVNRQEIAGNWTMQMSGSDESLSWGTLTDFTGGDITGTGVNDLLAVQPTSGDLLEFAAVPTTTTCPPGGGICPGAGPYGPFDQWTTIGSGTNWNGMSNLTITPSLDGGTSRDLVAVQNSTGELYAYPITSTGGLGTGVEIGTGWGSMTQLVGGTFYGKPGIVGIYTSTGDLRLYPSAGTSSLSTSTLGTMQKLATGWGQKTNLAAVNGVSGDSGTDISATDSVTGIPYLYHQTTTSSTFTGPTDLGMDVYTPPAGVYQDLFHQADGSWLLRDKDGTTYTFGGPNAPTGKLSQIADKDGHTQVLTYVGGQLTTVTDSTSGRALHVTWNTAGKHIASVATDPVTVHGANPLTWNYSYNTKAGGNPDELDTVCAPPTGGNTAASCTNYSYTSGTSSGSHYRTTVMDADPSSYWRFGETGGDTAASQVAANEGNDNAAYSQVTLGSTPGPLVQAGGSQLTAATFNGTSSAVTLPSEALKDNYLAVGLWFKTTSPGILMEEQNQALTSTTAPSHGSPVLYVDTNGLLRGELYGSAIGNNPITSTVKVNDGNWHYAVLSGAGNTQTLYLDGAPVNTTPLTGAIGHLDMSYTSVGAGYAKALPWPQPPAASANGNNYFSGSIAEVALYQHPLGAPAIAEQYAAQQHAATELTGITLPSGKQAVTVAYDSDDLANDSTDRAKQVTDANGGVWKISTPAVSGSTQEYRASVMASQPSGYWRLSDGSGTEAANQVYSARPTPDNGTYSNVTLGAAGPLASASGTAASFDGATSSLQLPASNIPKQGPGTISLWFKTTTAGVLFSYQSFPIGSAHTSTDAWNPALYVGTDGYLHGELFTGSAAGVLASTTKVNDGKWHFAVLDATATNSQTLYLDGGAAAGPLSGTIVPNGTAYAYVGAGATAGTWPAAPTDPDGHFNGQIADVAAFPQGLSTSQIQNLESTAGMALASNCLGCVPPFDQSLYDTAILDAHPLGYWPLGDTSGNQAAEEVSSAAEQQNQGTYNGVVTSATGPWASGTTTAAALDGTDAYIPLPSTVAPTTGPASVELWFKATGPGVLYSYQSFPLGATHTTSSNRWNPALYIGTDGKVYGELGNETNNPAVSTNPITYGQWYQVALVATATSQQLYLDGQPTGSPITGSIAYNGQSYAYLGAGTDDGAWPNHPTDVSGHLPGALADFASYDYALDAATITSQYTVATSATVAGSTGTDASTAYRAQVVQDDPTGYWRLDEQNFNTPAADELGTALPDPYAGTYSNVTLNGGGAGPSGNPDEGSAAFNGTSSSLQLPAADAPTSGPASIELWFKTTTAGVLYSYASAPLGAAQSAWDPALYVGTDGKLHGLFMDIAGSSSDQMTSGPTVTDNKWHQAVLSATGTTETLYLDGAQQATESKGTLQFNGTPYVYLGAGTSNPNGWTDAPACCTSYFTGSIAEAAYYPSTLSATAVLTHYKAMASSASPTPVTTATVTDPGNNTLTYQYNATTEQLLAYTDAYGDTTRYTYDTNGYLQTVTDPDGHTTTTGHDARGNTVSTTTCRNPGNCQTSYATFYLNLTNGMDPQNDEMLTSSDSRSASSTDTTYTTSYSYDALGHPEGTRTPSGRSEGALYTAGTEVAIGGGTEPAGLPALSSDWDPTHAPTRYSYYSNGDLAQSVSPLRLTTSYTYDGLGRVLTKTEVSDTYPNGLVTSYTWDGQSNPLTQTDPATTDADTGTVHTQQTGYTYDADGDALTQVVSDLTGGDTARTTSWQYNSGDDQVKQVTDPAGHVTQYTYDAYGNIASTTNAAGTVYDYTYSPMGQLQQTAIGNYTGDPTSPVSSRSQVIDSKAYDPAGRLASDTDAMGRTTSYFYNDDNTLAEADLTGFHNPDGTTRNVVEQQNSYDNAGHLIQQVTGGGTTTTDATYDIDGRQTSTTLDPGGLDRVTSYTLDPDSDVTADKLTGSGQTRETDYTYDALGDALSQTVVNSSPGAPGNSVSSYTYDERGLPLTETSPNGNTAAAAASAAATTAGDSPTAAAAAGAAAAAAYTTSFTYDPMGQLTQTTAPKAPVTSYSTTTNTPTTNTSNAIISTGYDTFGDTTSTDDADGNLITYTYNPDGQPTAESQPAYTAPDATTPVTPSVVIQYDQLGRPHTSTVDPSGLNRTTTTTYDQLGDVVQLAEPKVSGGTPTWQYSYDLDGELLSAQDPNGAVTQATYDDLGRKITSTQVIRQPTATSDTTSYTYDDAGDELSLTPPAPESTTSYTYDAAGEKLTSTDALHTSTSYDYDLAGELTSTKLPDQTTATNSYDQAGNPTATSNLSPTGAVLSATSATYDADGNQLTTTNADQVTTSYGYDADDDLVQESQPTTASHNILSNFGYDADGNRTAYTDGNQKTTYYTYNTLGLLESTIDPATPSYPDPANRTYTTSYDTAGEQTAQTLPGGVTTSSTYDADGNQLTQTGTGAQANTTARTFTYKLGGQLATAVTGSSSDSYTYDDRGKLLTSSGTSGSASYTYDADGNISTRTDTQGTATYGYDADGRLTTASEPLTGTDITYGYNNVDEVTSTSYSTGAATRSLGYDQLHRITNDTLTNPSGSIEASVTYGYNNDNDVTSKTVTGLTGASSNTYTYDQADRLTSWNNGTTTAQYAYDDDGNLTQSNGTTSTYDARDRLINSGNTAYTYDPRGNLATATTHSATTTSVYDAFNQLIDEGSSAYTYDALGRLTTANSSTFSYADLTDNLTTDGTENFDNDPDGNLVAVSTSNGTAGLAYNDHHDDLVATYTPSGNTLNGTAAYTPWGQTTATTNATTDLGYQGDWTDPTTQLVNTAARWYDPATGSFISRDPTNLDPTSTVQANRYAYADDQPLSATDRTGHSAEFHVGPTGCEEGDPCRFAEEGAGNFGESGQGESGDEGRPGDGGPDTGSSQDNGDGSEPGTTGTTTGGGSGGEGQSDGYGGQGAGDSDGGNGNTGGGSTGGSTDGGTSGDGGQAPAPAPPTAQQGVDQTPGDPKPISNTNVDPNTDNKITNQDPTKAGSSEEDPLKVTSKPNKQADGKTYQPTTSTTVNAGSTSATDEPVASGDECDATPSACSPTFVKLQALTPKELARPGFRYQVKVTGQDYEQVWENGGRTVKVDGGPTDDGYIVEAKWTGSETQWNSSPYNPYNYFNESGVVSQASKLLDLNSGLGGAGVRYAVSNPQGAAFFRAVFREWFSEEMENGTLDVWHVPGNGM